jgi:hypothetical protein
VWAVGHDSSRLRNPSFLPRDTAFQPDAVLEDFVSVVVGVDPCPFELQVTALQVAAGC